MLNPVGATQLDPLDAMEVMTEWRMRDSPHEDPTQEDTHGAKDLHADQVPPAVQAEEGLQQEQQQEAALEPIESTDLITPETTEPTRPLNSMPMTQPTPSPIVLVETNCPKPSILDIFDDE